MAFSNMYFLLSFFFKGEGLSVDNNLETDSEDKDVAEADVLPFSLQ